MGKTPWGRRHRPPPPPSRAFANALARLTPASGPPPRIPLVLAAVRGGFGGVLWPLRGRTAAWFWRLCGGCQGGVSGGVLWPLRGRSAAAQRPRNPPNFGREAGL